VNSFYCGEGHPLFNRHRVGIDDIRASRVIARSYWRRADLSRLGVAREAATVDIMEAQATLILSGAYLGYLPEHYAAPWVVEGRMRPLMPERLSYVAPFSMIARRGTAELRVVSLFIEDLRATVTPTAGAKVVPVFARRGRARRPAVAAAGG